MIQHVHLYKPVISSEQHNHISVIILSPSEELIYHKTSFFSKFTVIECHLQTQEHHFSPHPRKPPYLVNAPGRLESLSFALSGMSITVLYRFKSFLFLFHY